MLTKEGKRVEQHALKYAKVKVKVLPITGHEGPEGEYSYSPTLS